MKTIVNINGNICSGEEATISIFDRGFLYGDSIYEVTMTVQGKPIFLEEHLDRLENSAKKIALPLTNSREKIKHEILKTVKEHGDPRCYVRLIISRGEGPITLDPTVAAENNLILIVKTLPENPTWWYQKGVWMIVAETLRNPIGSIDPDVKSGNYLNNVMAYSEAKKQGAYDSIMLNHKGHVTEGTTNNLWMIKNNRVITPPLKSGLLSGITRKVLIKLCHENSIPFEEKEFFVEEMKSADECFLTSSTKGLVPIVQIDETFIKDGMPGEMVKSLSKIYEDNLIISIK